MIDIIFALLITNGFIATYIPRTGSTLVKIDITYCTPGELSWLNDELGVRGFYTNDNVEGLYMNTSERINVMLVKEV
jgi:hypothetical protein